MMKQKNINKEKFCLLVLFTIFLFSSMMFLTSTKANAACSHCPGYCPCGIPSIQCNTSSVCDPACSGHRFNIDGSQELVMEEHKVTCITNGYIIKRLDTFKICSICGMIDGRSHSFTDTKIITDYCVGHEYPFQGWQNFTSLTILSDVENSNVSELAKSRTGYEHSKANSANATDTGHWEQATKEQTTASIDDSALYELASYPRNVWLDFDDTFIYVETYDSLEEVDHESKAAILFERYPNKQIRMDVHWYEEEEDNPDLKDFFDNVMYVYIITVE